MNEMVVEGVSKGAKVGGIFASPLGKINLYISGVFLIFLIIAGVFQSVDQHSVYPLFENTVLKIANSDGQLSQRIDELESKPRPESPSGIFSKAFPTWLWFWCKWWFLAIIDIWLVWFLLWALYTIFKMIDQTSMLKNILLAVLVFALIQFFAGVVLYSMNHAGQKLPDDKLAIFGDEMKNSIPLHGTFKLVTHIFNKQLFYKVQNFAGTGFGQALTNIPINNSVNAT